MITESDIKKAAFLGEIDLTSHETKVLKVKLSEIFEYFSILDEIDINKPIGKKNIKSNVLLREDIVKKNENYLDLLKDISDLDNDGIVITGIRK
jgi:aspartyl/glutamyl-tRNA(Asn/Gln) amidotransferase C subunit